MADAVITRFRPGIHRPHPIESIELVPGGGGIFDVEADGVLIFSKHALGRHAEHGEIIEALENMLAGRAASQPN